MPVWDELRPYGWTNLWRPDLLAALLLVLNVYLAVTVWGRIRRGQAPPRGRQVASFGLGVASFYVAEGTPLHVLAENYLFSVHMLQHLLLTMAVPILVLLGTPDWLVRPLLRRPAVAAAARILLHPLVALLVFNLLFSFYHLPFVYMAGLQNEVLHKLEHAVLIVAALMTWSPLFSPLPGLRLSDGLQILYLFAQGVIQTAVFAMVTFADQPLYAWYAGAPRVLPLTAHQDQAVGGFLMRDVSMLILFIPLLLAFARWVRRETERFPLDPAAQPGPPPGDAVRP